MPHGPETGRPIHSHMRGESRPCGTLADRAGRTLQFRDEDPQKVLGIRDVTPYPHATGLVTALTFSRCEPMGRQG